jgi:hypothetical protein
MGLTVRKVPSGLYEASATPPHVKEAWSTREPLSARKLIEELKARGCHQLDIADAFEEQDPNWLEKL